MICIVNLRGKDKTNSIKSIIPTKSIPIQKNKTKSISNDFRKPIPVQELEFRVNSYSGMEVTPCLVNSHFEVGSVNKAVTTTSAIFPRNMYKFIIGGRQVFCGFVAFVTGS